MFRLFSCCYHAESRQLIAPCQCKGTQKYVHRSCLDSWRSAKVRVWELLPGWRYTKLRRTCFLEVPSADICLGAFSHVPVMSTVCTFILWRGQPMVQKELSQAVPVTGLPRVCSETTFKCPLLLCGLWVCRRASRLRTAPSAARLSS